MTSTGTFAAPRDQTWEERNHSYLDLRLTKLRLQLRQRALWFQDRWSQEPMSGSRALLVTDREVDLLLSADPDEEFRFRLTDPTSAAITDEIQRTDLAVAALVAAMGDSPPTLELLAQRFGLTDFERDVLVLCLAPERDPSYTRLFGYAHDDPNLGYPTPHLAQVLFGDAADTWAPTSPLLRYGMVEMADETARQRGRTPLSLDARILDYVQGTNRPDGRVADLLWPRPAVPLPPSLQGVAADARSRMHTEAATVVNLVGPAEVGRVVAAELLRQIGLAPHEWDVTRLPADADEAIRVLRLVEREAALLRLGLVVVMGTPTFALRHVLERSRVLLVLVSLEPVDIERAACQLRLPELTADERVWFWSSHLPVGSAVTPQDIRGLSQQFEFGPVTIARIAEQTHGDPRPDGAAALPGIREIWEACRHRGGRSLVGLGTRITCRRDWDELVLPDDAVTQLREIVSQVGQRARVYEEWGFGERLTRGRGITALFAGPSGTGKTMAAEVVGRALGLDICRVDLAGVISKYIGETEKNLQRVFAVAEEAGWILFFDEADALFGKRTEVKDSHDRYANIEVNYLLQRMEDYRGLAILATNRRASLDRAFLRRIRFLVDFPMPDADSRRRIWARAFPDRTPLGDLDLDQLARLDVTGANIATIATNAAFLAAADDRAVEMHHLMAAVRREFTKLDKLLPESDGARS